MALFLKDITLKNFRGFSPDSNISVPLKIPDGQTAGSGLTILVGENGSGKTTLLEAIDFLTKNPFSARNRLTIDDFNDKTKKLEITANTDTEFAVKRLWGTNGEFKASGFYFHANLRSRDETARLVDPIVLDNQFIQSTTDTTNIQEVEKRQSATGPYGADRVPLKVQYFDKNRSRHLVTNNYQTQLETVLDDLNFQFLKWLGGKNDTEKKTIATKVTTSFSELYADINDKIVSTAFTEVQKLIGSYEFKLDLGRTLEPYRYANIYVRSDDGLDQIPVQKLGSGIEMLCALVLLETIYKTTSADAIYCIDEPEMHLHPQFQKKLLDYLLELSKTRQIVISTHSPNFISANLLPNIVKLSHDQADIKLHTANNGVLNKLADNRNFFDRHKNLLFAREALFVEGATDIERYSLFLTANDQGELADDLYFMNGCDLVRFYESFCESYGIYFAAIVDNDYAYNYSPWDRSRMRGLLQRIKRDFDEFDLDGFIAKNGNQSPTAKTGNDAPTTITVDGTDITKVSQGNIYVLSEGEVMDFLDGTGNPINDDRKKELLAIFSQVRSDLELSTDDTP